MSDELDERVAIMIHDGELPEAWALFLGRLTTMNRPAMYPTDDWSGIIEGGCRLMEWLPQLGRNGWGPDEIKALLPRINGRQVIAVGAADVTVQMRGGDRGKILYRPNPGGVARWDEGRRSA